MRPDGDPLKYLLLIALGLAVAVLGWLANWLLA